MNKMDLCHARSMTVDIMVRGAAGAGAGRKIFNEIGFRPANGGRKALLNL
ncbi:hypothetical protein [Polaromonas sp. AET17H-212]|nr:hypothetical protein [Polaromonas sp. AET17H-212]